MTAQFQHTSQGRTPRTAVVLIAFFVSLGALFILFDAAWYILAPIALFAAPALWDLYANPTAGVTLDATRLTWFTGKRRAELLVSEIDHMRFDTRLDFSVRVSAVLRNGKRLRLPPEAVPPHKTFEAALQAQNIKTERHHFSLM